MHDEHDDHDAGLQADLLRLQALDRRRVLGWLAAAAAVPMVGCTPDGTAKGTDTDVGDTGPGGTGDTASDGACATIPEETEGPYPGDGSNGPDALALAGIVRKDIRPNVSGSGAAEGLLLTLRFRLLDTDGCTPLAGRAVYAWHCDRDGGYSMYTVASATYLRGVQVTDADGVVEFTTIFPGCYPGRWPHVHFEVYADVAATSSAKNVLATSQLAFPKAACEAAYTESGYATSVTNLAGVSLATDGVFRDGADRQVGTMSGEGATLTCTLDVAIDV
ncbi:MAG: hypothetical protein H6732_09945 [Alphaproteobacteria bacterium]|nr:hypothetical protein [Alphaproteobacteria bacterium]